MSSRKVMSREESLKKGSMLVNPKLRVKWRKFVEDLTDTYYDTERLDLTVRVLEAISKGRSPRQIEKIFHRRLGDALSVYEALRTVPVRCAVFCADGKKFLAHVVENVMPGYHGW